MVCDFRVLYLLCYILWFITYVFVLVGLVFYLGVLQWVDLVLRLVVLWFAVFGLWLLFCWLIAYFTLCFVCWICICDYYLRWFGICVLFWLFTVVICWCLGWYKTEFCTVGWFDFALFAGLKLVCVLLC